VGGGMSVGQGGGCASSITRLVSQTGTLSEEIDIKVARNYLSKLTKKLFEKYIHCAKFLELLSLLILVKRHLQNLSRK
jgi:hypothetical protein